jgi:exopolysaccharide production protein ExoZ
MFMFKTLQWGRGIAATSVVAFHLTRAMPTAPFEWFAGHGHLGVDFFFVLSGFIIVFAHHEDIGVPAAWPTFAYKRFVRIYPLYWLCTLFLVVATVLGLGSRVLPASVADWLTTLSLVRVSGFITPLPPAWTLFHEIAFYALFSTLILNRRLGIAVFILWTVTMLALFSYPQNHAPNPMTPVFSAYGLNFLFGMAAFYLYPRLSSRQALGCLIGGILLFLATVVFNGTGSAMDYSRPLYGVGLAAAIAGAVRLETPGLKFPLLTVLGNASFSIYLVHESVQIHLLRLVGHLHAPIGITYVIVLSGSLLFGCAVYALIERPLIALFKRRRNARKTLDSRHGLHGTALEASQVEAAPGPTQAFRALRHKQEV